MKIVVCVKFARGEINPFDEWALECALRRDGAEIILLCMGPPSAAEALKALTRLGNIRALLLSDSALAGSDTLATSYALSLAVKKLAPDLIICGKQSVDGDTGQVPHQLAQLSGLPVEVCEIRKSLRFPSLRSKPGEVEVWNTDALGADIARCGLQGSPTKVLKTFENNRGRRKCEFIGGSELLPLIEKLKKREKEAERLDESENKLKNIWIVGDELQERALSIAETVTVLQRQGAEEIAALALKKKPGVILWPTDRWGRKTAPQVAAMLQTGLCADCTHLETDGEKLFMYRPASGGSVIAKIECRTLPQMATVRTVMRSAEIIVSVGRGAAAYIDRVRMLAEKIGAQFGASRAAVDMGLMPYETQIGLTGKTVSPKIYIAIGISGAVQHVCAVESAQYIIAINSDKNAPIFDYADFGVVTENEL